MFKRFLFFIFLNIISTNINSKPITFEGLSKYTLDDIQSITSIDIFNNIIQQSKMCVMGPFFYSVIRREMKTSKKLVH